jgi:hypothetical protein
MDPEQRYLLDLQGYLVVEDALSSSELAACRDAADRYINGAWCPPSSVPSVPSSVHARVPLLLPASSSVPSVPVETKAG